MLVLKWDSQGKLAIEEGVPPNTKVTTYESGYPERFAVSANKDVIAVLGRARRSRDGKQRDSVMPLEVVRRGKTWKSEEYFEVKTDKATCLALAPDGGTAAVGTPTEVILVDTKGAKEIARAKVGEMVMSLCYSPDGKVIAVGDEKGNVRLCDVKSGGEAWVLQPHRGDVRAIAFSPDGSALASVSDDGTVRVSKTESGERVQLFKGHKKAAVAVAFSLDGKLVASAGYDLRILIWEVQTGRLVRDLAYKTGLNPCLAFAKDGSLVVTSNTFRQVFDPSGKLVHTRDTGKKK